ncbi:MAG: TonB-dependent receptor [Pseudomonadota bacterium]
MKQALLVSAAIAALCSPLAAHAQDTADQIDQTAEEAPQIFGNIIVTARKIEENSQDVPISISTFGGDALNEIGITGSQELGNLVPGLEIGRTNGGAAPLIIFLRGSGLNDFGTNNAGPVALYADDVYISSPPLTQFQFFDVERVEVLKGPQGTLYGRNTTGGAIKTISNKPTDEFEFRGRALVGEFEMTEFEAAISGPITEGLRVRAAIQKTDSDGYGTNLVDGSTTNGRDSLSWRAMADIDVADNFRIRLNVHGAHDNSEVARPNFLGIIPPDGSDIFGYSGPGTGNVFDGLYDPAPDNDFDNIGGYVDMEWEIGEVTITSVTAFDDVEAFNVDDTDAGPNEFLDFIFGSDSQTFTQELRATGRTGSLNWLVGAFYLQEELNQDQTADIARLLRDIPVEFGGTGGFPDPFGELTGGLPVVFARTINTQDTQTFAVFGQLDYALSDQWTVTVGGRFTAERRDFDGTGQIEEELLAPVPIPLYEVEGLEQDDDAVSFKFGLDYTPSDDVLLYASFSRGFKSGGFNGGNVGFQPDPIAALEPFEPEFVNAYELGFKSELLDNSLRINGAVFLNDTSDLQVFTLINTGDLPITQLTNAADAEVFGFELDVTAYPLDGVVLNFTTAYLDSELQNFISGNGEDLSGNQLAFTPRWSISGFARYDHDLGNAGSVYAQGSFSYKDDQFFSTENDPLAGQEAYTLVNARIGYETANGRFGIAAFVKNLTDEAYFTNIFDLTDFGFYQRFLGEPRQFGAEVLFNF